MVSKGVGHYNVGNIRRIKNNQTKILVLKTNLNKCLPRTLHCQYVPKQTRRCAFRVLDFAQIFPGQLSNDWEGRPCSKSNFLVWQSCLMVILK